MNNAIFVTKSVLLGDGKHHRLHTGMWDTWHDSLSHAVMTKLKEAVDKHPVSGHNGIYITGHSRGGAFANLGAVTAYYHADKLGLTDPRHQIKLFTMGAPRIGNQDFADLIESLIATRFRIINNADIVTAMPPRAFDWLFQVDYLLGDHLKHLAAGAKTSGELGVCVVVWHDDATHCFGFG